MMPPHSGNSTKCNIKRFKEAADEYRPKPGDVKTLLVGEAYPMSGNYFYIPKIPVAKNSMQGTIFRHYFGEVPKGTETYINYLEELRKRGISLMDVVEECIKVRDREKGIIEPNFKKVLAAIPKLKQRIRNIASKIDEGNAIFLVPFGRDGRYKEQIKESFPRAQIYSWVCFRETRE